MKVALVYDRVNKWGGAERVLLVLRKIFPDAPLYTSVYDPENAKWANVFDIKTSFLQNLPFIKKHNELFPFLMPMAFESFSFDEFDLVISVTSEAAKGIITKPATLHICTCLTPTRYLWSAYDIYFQSPVFRFFSKPAISYLRKWDKAAGARPDYFVSISNEVKKRIKKYYKRDSYLIYPPVEIQTKGFFENSNEKYFLLVSRLSKFVLYKKVDLVIDAFNQAGMRLKIVGEGSLKKRLMRNAKSNIEFLGSVNDEELEELYANCQALIFPGVEDFGLVMVEAQFFGTPVIAFRGGGALEIVKEGKTGEFFDEQKVSSLVRVLKQFDSKRYNKEIIKKNAMRFSRGKFEKAFKQLVEQKYKEHVGSRI